MKLKRLTAIVLTLAMLFSILPLTGTVYATENEEKEVDVTTADYPIMIKDRINTARLTKIGQYSELTDEEKDAVCKYYHLEDSIFVACEKAGYNILDSVRIAKAANAAEVTPAEYKEYVTAYGSEEEASHQLWGYKNFKDMLGEKYQHEFASLMKKGYRQADLRGTFHVANKLNTSMGEIVPDNKNITNKSEAKTELELFSNTYFCDAQKIQQVSKEKNVNLTELVSIISYDKAVTKENVVSSKESNNETKEKAMTASISSPNISQNSKINSLSHEFISAPISVYTENDEQVNASTGVFSYRENVVDLKGKGGLDLDLDLVFTGNANLYYGWSTSTETRTDWYNTSIGVTKNLINYPLGVGWSFNLPQISYTKEWESISSQSNPNLGRNVVTYRYHMKDGGAYKINGNTLVDYPRTDVTLSSATNDPDVSVSLWKKVTFADGRYESFDAEGRIRVMGDRWGNKIIFDYYPSTATSLRNYPEYAEGALGLITDSLGRKIRITYSQDPYENDDPHHRWVYIEYSDNTTSYEARIDMYAENSDAGPYKVQSIDVGPNGKTFTYHNEQTIQCTDELYTDDFDLIAGNNVILNMASVTYDSGLTSYYQYAKTTVNNGTGGAKNIYRVSNRYETDPN
ncbi:MAG: hypothetical protein IJ299_03835, partial [Oscillospiraceae bacterium]|nr:hypothetical protein [Oscillospiraceae bacterium]